MMTSAVTVSGFGRGRLLAAVAHRVCSSSSASILQRHQTSASGDQVQYRPINKDRTNPVPLETSLKYLESSAYQITYGDEPVWVSYRRNHKGAIPRKKTRRTCIRGNQISTGNPCPICRDEYLVLDYRNTGLLKQFICEYTGEVHPPSKTGLCQVKHRELLTALARARDMGTISFDVPFRVYSMEEYQQSE